MTNDIKRFIEVVNTDFSEKFDIVERIANSDPQELIAIVDQMDEDRIDEITELLSTINEGDNISEGLRDSAKSIWRSALKGAKNLASGRTFSKLAGVAKRLFNRNDVLKKWETYKGQFNIQNDNKKDIIRFIKTEFPILSDETIKKAQRDVKFQLDDSGNVTNFSNFIDGLTRVAGEAAVRQVSTGGPADGPASSSGRQSAKTQKSSVAPTKRMSPAPKISVKRAAIQAAQAAGHIKPNEIKLLSNVANIRDFNSIKDKDTLKALAAVAFYIMK